MFDFPKISIRNENSKLYIKNKNVLMQTNNLKQLDKINLKSNNFTIKNMKSSSKSFEFE